MTSPTPQSESSALPPTRLWSSRLAAYAPKVVVSLLIAIGFFGILRWGGLPMLPAPSAFSHLTWWVVPAYGAVYCVASFLRTYRWIYLLRPICPQLSSRRVLGIGLVGFTAVVFAPLRMGEVVRPWLLAQDGQVSLLQGTSTVLAERIVDGLTLTGLLIAALAFTTPLSPLPVRVGRLPLPVAAVPALASGALLVFTLAFVAMAAFYFWRSAARRSVLAVIGLVSPSLAVWVTERIAKLAEGLQFLPSGRHGGAFLRDTLLYWLASSVSTWMLLRGCGTPAGLAQACVIMGIMGIGTLIPGGPGAFGTYQLSAYCGLAMFFPEAGVLSAGALFIFVSYTTHVVLTAASAVLGAYLMTSSPGDPSALPG